MVWPRIVAHADMDAFYAAVEQLDAPSLRGRPLLVGPPAARGVVLTASYEARPYGVGSAMPMAKARRMCPNAVVVPPRFDRYQDVSATIMKVFSDFSPDVEALSLDEAFLDMTGSEQLFGDPQSIGRRLKSAIREATGGLTASVGLLHLRRSADTIGRRLRKKSYVAFGVGIKLKTTEFQILSRQHRLSEPTDVAERLYSVGVELLNHVDHRGPFRLVGLVAYDLVDINNLIQLDLFSAFARQRQLEVAIDGLVERFGTNVVYRADEQATRNAFGADP